jgi:hypothetical protein
VERWNGGTVERWNGGTVERWNGGTVERWNAVDHPTERGSSQRLSSLVFISLLLCFFSLVVFARFCAFSRVLIPNEFPADSARIGWEQIKTTNAQERAKTRECFLGANVFGVDPRPSASSALIRGSSYVFQASRGASAGNNLDRGFTRISADSRRSNE